MNPWQRLVGTQAEPRRTANPGVAFLAFALAVGWLLLGVSALSDGRGSMGVIELGLAVGFAACGIATLRKRRTTDA